MRKIRTSNNYCEFIEADSNGKVLSSRGFQFGELYFQIKNGKVTFYLNDQENPWRNDVWTINIPFELDGVQYDTEDAASAALHNIMNDRFQEQLDELKEGLAAEEARAQEAEEQLDDKIDDETARAVSAETHLQDEVTELSGTVATFDERITRNTNDISALTNTVNAEIARSTAKDAEHDTAISGLTADLATETANRIAADNLLQTNITNEVNRATSAETTLHNEIISERDRALAAESALTDALNAEVTRSTAKDASHDASISGLTTSLQNEINRATGAENSLRNDLNSEISARTANDAEELQRIASLETGKADANSVYTKTESDNKYATKDYLSGLTENIYTKGEVNTLLNDKADKVSAVSSAIYNSQSKTIDFKNISGTVISSIDARDFIKDGMVDNVEIVGNNLVITFNTDAGKEAITVSLASIFDPTNYYNKAEIDAALSGKASTGDVQTISGDVQTLSGEVQTISGSAITSGEVVTLINDATSGKTIDYLSAGTNVQINNNVISATDTKYTAGESINIDENKIISLKVPIWRANNQSTSVKENDSSNVVLAAYSHAEGYHTKANGNQSHAEGSSSVASGSVSHAEGEGTIANGNYSHSEGHLCVANGEASHAGGYSTRTNNRGEFASGNFNVSNSGSTTSAKTLFSVGNGTADDARHNAFEIKQNGDIYITSGSSDIKLQDHLGGGGSGVEYSAGTNVQINNHIISATDTTYSAGDGIDITNNVISTVTKFACVSESEWASISGNPQSNTVYMIY